MLMLTIAWLCASRIDAVPAPKAIVGPPKVFEQAKGMSVWQPKSTVDGALVQLEVSATDCKRPKANWQDKVFWGHQAEGGWHVLLPVPLELTPGVYIARLGCDGEAESRISISLPVIAGDYPESTLRVDPKFSRKPPDRVADERQQITDATAHSVPKRLWSAPFVRPATGPNTSVFGVRRTFNKVTKSRHRGLDMDGKRGDPLLAANDGIVALVAKDFYYVGNAVFLDHGEGLFSLYLHLTDIHVEKGAVVRKGEQLGTIGDTGRVTGPHVHFAVKWHDIYFNPQHLLDYQL